VKIAASIPAPAVKAAETPAPQEPESIAQTNSSSDELMTNSADKQEVDTDTNEQSNMEKMIEE